MSKPFEFKQFTVAQDRCAMKIGTDGVLLGAWAPLQHAPESILDVGAGTGVIALQLAQRSEATLIDALEIDADAYEQCTDNFEASLWGDRLFCYHASFQEFASEMEERYDLIVSNPPFYTETVKSENPSRDLARFEDALPFEHLVICVRHLLSDKGVFATILPYKEQERFLALTAEAGLFPMRICTVQGTPDTPPKRILLAFSLIPTEVKEETLIIEEGRHQYTEDYRALVQDFYLKM